MTLWKWSKTAATNATADSTVNYAEGQAPSSVNDSARAAMAAVAKYRDDTSGMITTGGSANTYTFSTNQGLTELTDGFEISFTLSATNTGASTLNVDSLGAVALQKIKGTALGAGELVAGCVYTATYDSASTAAWVIHGGRPAIFMPPGAILPYCGYTPPTGFLFCYGQAISRTTYADLFAAIATGYGTGDGSTTFNVPDLRGRVIAAADDMGGVAANRITLGGLSAVLGAETHTLSTAELPTITPAGSLSLTSTLTSLSLDSRGDYASGGGSRRVAQTGGISGDTNFVLSSSITTTGTFSGTPFGSDDAHNNLQPTICLYYIIKF